MLKRCPQISPLRMSYPGHPRIHAARAPPRPIPPARTLSSVQPLTLAAIARASHRTRSYPRPMRHRCALVLLLFAFAASNTAGARTPASGISGRVVAGPTCPVETVPPQPGCAPRPLAATLRIRRVGSHGAFTRVRSGVNGRSACTSCPRPMSCRRCRRRALGSRPRRALVTSSSTPGASRSSRSATTPASADPGAPNHWLDADAVSHRAEPERSRIGETRTERVRRGARRRRKGALTGISPPFRPGHFASLTVPHPARRGGGGAAPHLQLSWGERREKNPPTGGGTASDYRPRGQYQSPIHRGRGAPVRRCGVGDPRRAHRSRRQRGIRAEGR